MTWTRRLETVAVAAAIFFLAACTGLAAESRGGGIGDLIEGAAREAAEREVRDALGIPLVNEEGEPWGEVRIDEHGLRVYDAEGNLVSRIDPTGSLHNRPEVFNAPVTLNGGVTLAGPDGPVSLTAHELAHALQQGGGLFMPEIGDEVLVGFEQGGLEVHDAAGNLLFKVDEKGSVHNVPETFNGGITIPLNSGGKITITDVGIEIEDKDGKLRGLAHDGGSMWYGETYPEHVNTKSIEIPLGDGVIYRVDEKGVRITDKDGNVLWSVDENGSKHAKPEEFAGGVTIPLTGGGSLTLDGAGLTIKDKDGNLRGLAHDTGSMWYGDTFPEKVNTKSVTISMDGEHQLITDKDGVRIVDKDGNVLWSVDENGSKHAKPEEFAGGITIPLTGGGKITLTGVGMEVLDKDGNLRGLLNDGGSMWYGDVFPERVTTKSVTIDMGDGVKYIVDDGGVRIVDKDGNVLWSVDENGSKHAKPEEFSEIRMPLVDDDGVSQGTMVMDREGLWIENAAGKVVYALDERASLHLQPEEFAEIIVPQAGGGEIVIDANGIRQTDASGRAAAVNMSLGSDAGPHAGGANEIRMDDAAGGESTSSWIRVSQPWGGVTPGVALDPAGRELVIEDDTVLDVTQFAVEYAEDGSFLRARALSSDGCLPTGRGGDLCIVKDSSLVIFDLFGEEISRPPMARPGCLETRRKTLICLPPVPVPYPTAVVAD